MDSNRETKKSKVEDGIDIISDLPDPILCKILSYLPTQTAFSTSILSTRWNSLFPFIWVHPITLDLADSSFATHANFNDDSLANFADFTDKILDEFLSNVCCIQTLKLKCLNWYGDETIISWVYEALQLNVRELFLELPRLYSTVELFDCFNGCTTLTRLELGAKTNMVLPNISVPNLTTLVLDELNFIDELHNVISSFPALTDLTLRGCSFEHREYALIQSTVLKKLTLDECEEKSSCFFVISTPNVQVLWFCDCPAKDYVVTNLKSLRAAIIDIALPRRLYMRGNYDVEKDEDAPHIQFADGVWNLVAGCSSTIHLYLGSYTIEALHHSPAQLPVFKSLTSFALTLGLHGWEILARVLCNAPSLKKLRIGKEYGKQKKGGYSNFISFSPSCPPICLELQLKEIEFWFLRRQKMKSNWSNIF